MYFLDINLARERPAINQNSKTNGKMLKLISNQFEAGDHICASDLGTNENFVDAMQSSIGDQDYTENISVSKISISI